MINLISLLQSAEKGYVKFFSSFWNGYPDEHVAMPWLHKLFYILQISYWVHVFPELYLCKTKKVSIEPMSLLK